MPEIIVQERIDSGLVVVYPRTIMSNFYAASVMCERRKLRYADFTSPNGNLVTEDAEDWDEPDRMESAYDVLEKARLLRATSEVSKMPAAKTSGTPKRPEEIAAELAQNLQGIKPTEFDTLGDADLATLSAVSIQRGNKRLIEIVPPASWIAGPWCYEATPQLAEPFMTNGDLSVIAPESEWAKLWTEFLLAVDSPKMNALMFTPEPSEYEARDVFDSGKVMRTLATKRRIKAFRRMYNTQATLIEAQILLPMLEEQRREHERIGETEMHDLIAAAIETAQAAPMHPISRAIGSTYRDVTLRSPDGVAQMIPVLGRPNMDSFKKNKEPLLGGSGSVLLTALYSMKKAAAAFREKTASGRIGLLSFLLRLRAVMRDQTAEVMTRLASTLGWSRSITMRGSGTVYLSKPAMQTTDGDAVSENVMDVLLGLSQCVPLTATNLWPLVPDRMKVDWKHSILPVPFMADPEDYWQGGTPHDIIPTGAHLGEPGMVMRQFQDIATAREFHGMDLETLKGVMVDVAAKEPAKRQFYPPIPGEAFYAQNGQGKSTRDTLGDWLTAADKTYISNARIGVHEGMFYHSESGFNARVVVTRTHDMSYLPVWEGKVSLASRSALTYFNTGEIERRASRPGAQAIFTLLKSAGVVRETK